MLRFSHPAVRVPVGCRVEVVMAYPRAAAVLSVPVEEQFECNSSFDRTLFGLKPTRDSLLRRRPIGSRVNVEGVSAAGVERVADQLW